MDPHPGKIAQHRAGCGKAQRKVGFIEVKAIGRVETAMQGQHLAAKRHIGAVQLDHFGRVRGSIPRQPAVAAHAVAGHAPPLQRNPVPADDGPGGSIETALIESLQDHLGPIGFGHRIVIDEGDDFSGGGGDAGVARRRDVFDLLVQ